MVFRGVIENSSDSQTTHTFDEIKGNARRVTGAISSLIQKDKRFKMGDKTFIFDLNAIGKLSPLLALSGAGAVSPMMSAFSSSNDINLESGDEVIVAALKDKNTGLYRVETLKNLNKDYYFSHLKHDSLYLTLLAIFGFMLINYLILGLFMYLSDNKPAMLMNGIFYLVALVFHWEILCSKAFLVLKKEKAR